MEYECSVCKRRVIQLVTPARDAPKDYVRPVAPVCSWCRMERRERIVRQVAELIARSVS